MPSVNLSKVNMTFGKKTSNIQQEKTRTNIHTNYRYLEVIISNIGQVEECIRKWPIRALSYAVSVTKETREMYLRLQYKP